MMADVLSMSSPQQFFIAAKCRFHALAFGDIADGSTDQRTFRSFQRAQTDFHRELPTILVRP